MNPRHSDAPGVRPRFLVLGGSGYLGRHLHRVLGPERTVATYHSTPFPGGVHFDASRTRLADTLLRSPHHFTAAFILYGVTRIDDCARDRESTTRLNVDSVVRIIDELIAAGIKPVYASSDAVFDGSRGEWTEDDPPNPILTYGRQKAMVEKHLLGKRPPWIIARLSKLVGGESDPHCLLAEWLGSIEEGRVIRCATDLVFTPIHVEDAAACLRELAEQAVSGIYNVCGPRSMSRFALLQTLLAALRGYPHPDPSIVRCSIRDFPFLEPRPLNGSMSPAKLRSLPNLRLRDMDTVCAQLVHQRYRADRTEGHTEVWSHK